MATVTKDFKCKVTKKIYRAGQPYEGDRLEELQRLGFVEVSEEKDGDDQSDNSTEWPRHVGGGFYELSNGDRVKGKEAAHEAQAELA